MPNPYVIFNAITLGEAKESSEIENIVTTFDEIFKEMSYSKTNPASKEVLNYRQAMLKGYNLVKENGFLKPVQVDALKNYPNLSNVTQFSVISIMNDALPKKSKESKLSFSAKKLDKYFPPQYSTKERENIIIQLLEQWSADQVQSE